MCGLARCGAMRRDLARYGATLTQLPAARASERAEAPWARKDPQARATYDTARVVRNGLSLTEELAKTRDETPRPSLSLVVPRPGGLRA